MRTSSAIFYVTFLLLATANILAKMMVSLPLLGDGVCEFFPSHSRFVEWFSLASNTKVMLTLHKGTLFKVFYSF